MYNRNKYWIYDQKLPRKLYNIVLTRNVFSILEGIISFEEFFDWDKELLE